MNRYITFEEAAKAFSMQTMWSYGECLSMLEDAYAKGNISIEDVKPVVHGEWNKQVIRKPFVQVLYSCSECKRTVDLPTIYCPHCLAKMDRGDKDEKR